MQTSSLATYSRTELESLLTVMRRYKSFAVQAGNRARLIDPKDPHMTYCVRVEYPSSLDIVTVKSFVENALSLHFPETKEGAYSIEYHLSPYIV